MKKREFVLKTTVDLDLDDIPDWLWKELCQTVFSDLMFTLHTDGTAGVHGMNCGDSFAKFDLFKEVEKEIKDSLGFKSEDQRKESVELLSGLKGMLSKSLGAVNTALNDIEL